MNCTEVQSRLSEYIDQLLAPADNASITAHLSGCHDCCREMDALRDCIQQIATLTSLEPPLGFTQRVMAHIGEIEPQASLWQRWLAIFRNKITLQATAAVLVGIVGVYLFRQDDPTKQLFAPPPSPTADEQLRAPRPQEKLADARLAQESKKLATEKEEAARTATTDLKSDANEPVRSAKTAVAKAKSTEANENRVAGSAKRQIAEEPTVVASLDRLAAAPVAENKPASTVSLGATRGLEMAAAPAPVAMSRKPSSGTIVGTPVFNDSFAQPRLRRAPSVLESFRSDNIDSSPLIAGGSLAIPVEPVPDYEIVVRRRANLPADAPVTKPNAESAGLRREGRAYSAADRISPATMPNFVEIIWYSVPANHYEQFKKEIASQGIIETELPVAIKTLERDAQSDRHLSVKVVILPAAPANP